MNGAFTGAPNVQFALSHALQLCSLGGHPSQHPLCRNPYLFITIRLSETMVDQQLDMDKRNTSARVESTQRR